MLVACTPAPLGDSEIFLLTSASSEPVLCVAEDERERVRGIMLDALDDAFKEHVVHLYEVMMKAGGDPQRAATGTRQGLRAYLGGREAVRNWNPPPCAG